MKTTLVRYRTHAERADENEVLVRAVLRQLAEKSPPDLRYAALRLPDATFYHLAIVEKEHARSPLLELPTFRAFQEGIRERCLEAPLLRDATLLGGYRMVTG